MSNLNIQQTFQIKMPIYKNYLIINDNKDKTNRRIIVLAPITEEIEKTIDNLGSKYIILDCVTKSFKINHNNIYCYGEIDFNDIETCNTISNFDFLNYLNGSGIPIYANYDYSIHACYSSKKYATWAETWNPLDLVKYAHGCLNKPQRVILFKYFPNGKVI